MARPDPSIGFLINPIAGMGGRVGLKGTDDVVEEAIRRGAEPVAARRAGECLRELRRLMEPSAAGPAIRWLTCSGAMGADALSSAGFENMRVVHHAPAKTSRDDTAMAARKLLEAGAGLILFCGGDGTARDICAVTGTETPILGIPSGVKMYSGVFGITPARTAAILQGFLAGRLVLADADVLDLDEERFRAGEWVVRLYHAARTPYEPSYTQAAKALIDEQSGDEVKSEIAAYLCEYMDAHAGALFLLGPGSTVKSIADRLGVRKTLLGVDAVAGARTVGFDLNEKQILELLESYADCRAVLSPIGAQGFVLGRGNLQLSPRVLRRIGRPNLMVVATPAKLARTPVLMFDTGSAELDAELAADGYLPVITGYRRRRLVRIGGAAA